MIAPLEAWGVPLVGSGSDGLAAENKAHTKRLLVENGVPTPAYEVINGETDLREISARLGLPLIVKPLVGAESHGVIKCDDLPSLSAAVEPGLLVEQWKRHRELTVSVLGNGETRIAAPGEIVLPPAVEYLDLATKRERIVPTLAPAPDNDGTRKAVAVALDACRVLAVHDWARVDVLLDHEENPYVIDVNALPGLRKVADHPSYFPRCLALTTGMSYQQVVLALVAAAASRQRLPVPPAASSLPGTLSP